MPDNDLTGDNEAAERLPEPRDPGDRDRIPGPAWNHVHDDTGPDNGRLPDHADG
jgi:hypothetical protein